MGKIVKKFKKSNSKHIKFFFTVWRKSHISTYHSESNAYFEIHNVCNTFLIMFIESCKVQIRISLLVQLDCKNIPHHKNWLRLRWTLIRNISDSSNFVFVFQPLWRGKWLVLLEGSLGWEISFAQFLYGIFDLWKNQRALQGVNLSHASLHSRLRFVNGKY